MVSDTTETSITWTWTASEGALGYAVQVSHDEMFDDTDQVALTQETSFTAADIPPQTSLYLRVAAGTGTPEALAAAVATGDLSGLALSAWTTHVTGMSAMPPPPPPAPMAPATPTGLMAEEGEGSITWSWDAVEGADGYAIQVSTDETFDDMDEMTYTMETMHTASELGYGETRRARVASTSGEGEAMLMSMWTTHVTGMSMAKPAPVVPALEVSFSLDMAKNKTEFLVPDPGLLAKNKEKATASVNTGITVESNVSAVITPMFVPDANAVTVAAGSDNMPFAHVDWSLLQSKVLSDGATFMIQRATIGANQGTEPEDGDVVYVTCGPWSCQSGKEAPDLPSESMACRDWTWSLNLVAGFVDNTLADPTPSDPADLTAADMLLLANDGVDVGWVYETNKPMTVTHHFGNTFEVKGPDSGEVSRKTKLSMLDSPSGADPDAKGTDARKKRMAYDPALTVRYASAPDDTTAATDPDSHVYTADSNIDSADTSDTTIDADSPACTSRAYDEGELGLNKPDGCFRVNAAGNANYLADYEVEVGLKDGTLTWGANTFKDLKCQTHRVEAAMDVDVCMLFEDELTRSNVGSKAGWGTIATTATAAADGNPDKISVNIASKAKARQFSTAWFDNDQKASSAMVDLYVSTSRLMIELLDDDGDPLYGDIGKVDLWKGDPGSAATKGDGTADNYLGTRDGACDDEDGAGCDASETISVEVAFSPGDIFGCDPVEHTLKLACDWDAQGEKGRGAAVEAAADITLSDTNLPQFLSCSLK